MPSLLRAYRATTERPTPCPIYHKPKIHLAVTAAIRREMKRRAAVEPVIGHLKAEHRMGRNYLKGPEGDRINAVLAAAGFNFSLLLRWLESYLRAFFLLLAKFLPATQIA